MATSNNDDPFLYNLESKKREYQLRLDEIEGVIKIYLSSRLSADGTPTSPDIIIKRGVDTLPINLKEAGTIKGHITYVFNQEKRFLHKRELVAKIKILDPDLDLTKLKANIINYLRDLKAEGKLVFRKDQGRTLYSYWGSPKWLDNENNIKPEYMYKRIDDAENTNIEE
jgi:hypothetical protein